MRKLKAMTADPDSHWRLRGCKCGCEKPEYILLGGEGREEWTVECPVCGAHTPRSPIRHDVQVYWNRNLAAPLPKVRVTA